MNIVEQMMTDQIDIAMSGLLAFWLACFFAIRAVEPIKIKGE